MGLFSKVKGSLAKAAAGVVGKVLQGIPAVRRWTPLVTGLGLVAAGILRLAGQVTEAKFVEDLVTALGFQTDIEPGEVGLLLGTGSGLVAKFVSMWRKARA